MSDPCLANNVNSWINNNCTSRSIISDQSFFDKIFTSFYGNHEGLYLGGINNVPPETLQFQDLLADVCNVGSNGRYCRAPLLNLCANYTRTDAENPMVRKLCGCYLPPSEYNPDLNIPCDSVCSSFGTVRYFKNAQELTPEVCASNVCIIDGVTLNIKNSNVGDITFNQLCPFCSGISECRCFINDINIITQNSALGSVEINQNCGKSSVCTARSLDGTLKPVPCDSYFSTLGENPSIVEQQKRSYRWMFWVCIVLSVFFLGALILGLYFMVKEPRPVEKIQTIQYYTVSETGEKILI